jgi:hypothetical protein
MDPQTLFPWLGNLLFGSDPGSASQGTGMAPKSGPASSAPIDDGAATASPSGAFPDSQSAGPTASAADSTTAPLALLNHLVRMHQAVQDATGISLIGSALGTLMPQGDTAAGPAQVPQRGIVLPLAQWQVPGLGALGLQAGLDPLGLAGLGQPPAAAIIDPTGGTGPAARREDPAAWLRLYGRF